MGQKQIHLAEMENQIHEKQLLFLRGTQSRSCNNVVNNRLIVSVRPSSYGCTRKLLSTEGALQSHKAIAECNPFSMFPRDLFYRILVSINP